MKQFYLERLKKIKLCIKEKSEPKNPPKLYKGLFHVCHLSVFILLLFLLRVFKEKQLSFYLYLSNEINASD